MAQTFEPASCPFVASTQLSIRTIVVLARCAASTMTLRCSLRVGATSSDMPAIWAWPLMTARMLLSAHTCVFDSA